MTPPDIERIASLMDRHSIAAFDYENGAQRLALRRGQNGSVQPTPVPDARTGAIRSPCVGWMRFAHPVAGALQTGLPRSVRAGEVVAYVAAGPMLRAVRAENDCILSSCIAGDGSAVGYGDRLFDIILSSNPV